MQTRELQVGENEARQRLDIFLAEAAPELTRSRIQGLIKEGLVTVNGASARASSRLHPGDKVSLTVPRPRPVSVEAQDIPLEIYYEDPHLLVVMKPAGLVVHPAPGRPDGTLVNALLHHCRDLAGIGGELRPGIVHRLDKDTSGLLVVAKDDETHTGLARQFKARTVRRHYRALVWGAMATAQGRFEEPIGRHPTQRKLMSVHTRRPRPALTTYRVLRSYPWADLLWVKLGTGRTHQVRVHLAHAGHPVVGDPTYGRGPRKRAQQAPEALRSFPRQALHAESLGFRHPVSGEELDFEAPPPSDLQGLLDLLEEIAGGAE